MNDEELLKVVQEETPNDEYEQSNGKKATRIAVAVGIACMLIMFCVELIVWHRWDFGKAFLILIMSGVSNVIEGFQNQKKKLKVLGIMALVGAAVALFGYVMVLVGVI